MNDKPYFLLNIKRSSKRRWLFASISILATMGLLSFVVLIPKGVRALPGRYAARLPGFLQEMRQRPHPDLLPTPALAPAEVFSSSTTATSSELMTATVPRLRGVTFTTPTAIQQTEFETERPDFPPSPTMRITTAIAPLTLSTRQATLSPTPTTMATDTPTPMLTSTATATASPTPTPQIPISATLPPLTHIHQTWNNCGPATVSMALYYFQQSVTQADAALFLKPDPEDKNVSPDEMAAYVRSLGLEALVRVGGDLERLKRLIAAGFPVIVETWFIPEPGDQMGHYRLLTGYDDAAGQFIAQDSYNGPNVRLGYDAFDELWRVFNRVYLIIYDSSRSEELAALLGHELDDQIMYTLALETAQAESVDPSAECVAYADCADSNAFAWFNVGSNLTRLGLHEEAAAAYDQARLLGLPWRMLWYQFGPYESYYAVDRFQDVIALATATLNVVDNLEESHYWRGMAYLAQGNTDRARRDFQAAIKYNPNFTAAKAVLESLE